MFKTDILYLGTGKNSIFDMWWLMKRELTLGSKEVQDLFIFLNGFRIVLVKHLRDPPFFLLLTMKNNLMKCIISFKTKRINTN